MTVRESLNLHRPGSGERSFPSDVDPENGETIPTPATDWSVHLGHQCPRRRESQSHASVARVQSSTKHWARLAVPQGPLIFRLQFFLKSA